MDAIVILGIAVLCGVIYLIGHTHGRSAAPVPQVLMSGITSKLGTGSTSPAGGTQPGDAPQIKSEG